MAELDKILNILDEHKGTGISGQDMAEVLHVSRNAVWKDIERLRAEGYMIHADSHGYTLDSSVCVLTQEGIFSHLKHKVGISVLGACTSTNTLVRDRAVQGDSEYTTIVAMSQSDGRGRKGRAFVSPMGNGIYMSMLLRPSISVDKSVSITTATAVAVYRAIRDIAGIETSIKWVNDIYIGAKKLVGILTEGAIDIESGNMQYAILGIGINVSTPREGYPISIQDIATSIYGDNVPPHVGDRLVATIIDNVIEVYEMLERGDMSYMNTYRDRCMLIGKDVYIAGTGERVVVLGVNDDGTLSVDTAGGRETLFSGEVSVRLDENI